MNWKDLLTSEGRVRFKIEWNTKKLLQRYAQPDVRREAAEKLRRIGSPEAILSLARRFSVTTENLGVDQDEKQYVRDILVEFGEGAIDPLERYLRSYDQVAWAIECLKVLEPSSRLAEFLLAILHQGDPVQIRATKATQVLHALETLQAPGIVEGVIPCLASADDTVRVAAVDCLEAQADDRARDAMLEALVNEEDSLRVRDRIAEAFEKLGWDVRGFRKKVEEALPPPYRVSSRGRVVR
jgi:HEAT repeat protein